MQQRWLLLIGVFLWAAPLARASDRVDPGDRVQLREQQGLLLLAVDSPIKLYSATLNHPGKVLGPVVLRKLEPGRQHALYVVDAGRYMWQSVKPIANWRLNLISEDTFAFDVRPGVINYPGDLVIDMSGGWISDLGLYDRALPAIDWLQAQHADVLEQYPLQYTGHYPDPFPDYYRELKGKAEPDVVAPTPATFTEAALSPEQLWRDEPLRGLSLSPDGRFLVLHLRPEPDEQQWQIDLIDLQAGQRRMLARSVLPYRQIDWSGSRRLLLESGPKHEAVVEVIVIDTDAAEVNYDHIRLARRGSIVHALPAEPDEILLSSLTRRGELMVHRIDISSQARVDAFHGGFANRLNRGVEQDRQWLADAEGRLRLALAEGEESMHWMYGIDGEFKQLPEFEDPSFMPISLSSDASRILGLSDFQREQRDLVEIEAATGRIVETLYSSPGVDVNAAIQDADGQPIGVSYYRQGRLVSEYFDQRQGAWARRLQQAFPDQSIDVAAGSADGATQLIWVDASDKPPQLYHFDRQQRTASLVLERMPQLAERAFVSTQALQIAVADASIEAFLTLPAGEQPRPLVVYPHGGPIGIADNRHFSPDVQLLAAEGFAVLQVNFRGSEGYGRAFREAGHRRLGREIEDDIDAAIQYALANHPLDGDRICVIGSSYGGYSALIAAVRWPERFRCVVSIAGVTDRLLRFTASDGAQTEEGRSKLVEILGDPDSELEQLRENSPLYRYEQLRTPVLLVHGRRDRRVDAEHSIRLQRLLTLDGRPPAALYFDEEGHGLAEPEHEQQQWATVVGFLRQHLAD
ncbi:MAG: S9 family peptidase [Xanthomonadales bacterium]|nr:S9 family peptidase [Xanthomonadales bacterium]